MPLAERPEPDGLPADCVALLLDWLLDLQGQIQRRTAGVLQGQSLEQLAAVAAESAGDTIYALDQDLDEVLHAACRRLGERYPFILIAEGGGGVYPPGATEADALFRLIVDPLDGTRGLMYDKRSAWTLAGVAPNRGPQTSLADIVLAVQTEIPTRKQTLADTLWAMRGGGVQAWRRNLLTGEEESFSPRPSGAPDLSHGFAMLSKFFPGRKAIACEIEERLLDRLGGLTPEGRARVFDDQYICSGGQIYELTVGHDRFVGDIRPALIRAAHLPGYAPGLTAHPYDLSTELIAREAGVVVTDLYGRPLSDPLSEDTPVSWLGYANRTLQGRIEPLLQELLREYGLI